MLTISLCAGSDLAKHRALETDGVWVVTAVSELSLKEPGEKQQVAPLNPKP
jgi:hypothetical protein